MQTSVMLYIYLLSNIIPISPPSIKSMWEFLFFIKKNPHTYNKIYCFFLFAMAVPDFILIKDAQ